ncbi:polyketide synthase protein [Venturia nashicola]|uniref:Polyketide synthase protein n=1 Tax=Venturia nashicola TaxID=86259 RepID=A0A4Z1NXV2_9PEZI|nr:polyketide synthase protein [Venturia nashicola]TLD23515.1 polyketide synthase protein [Venturia nashicola]
MAPTTTINTSLPASATPESVIAAMHNHDVFIKITTPALITFTKTSTEEPALDVPIAYSITDKKPVGQTTYTLTLTNRTNGIDTHVLAKPPVGSLIIKGEWRVVDGTIKEDVDIDTNFAIKRMVKGNIEKTHPEQHTQLIAEAGKA